jgi:hypothetical protein
LFGAVVDFISQNTGLQEEEAVLLTSVCFSSFFCDVLSMSPSVLLFGAPLQAVSVLHVLGCVSRHPMLSTGSSVSGLPPELRPTRLVCQLDPRVEKQLPALQFSGFSIAGRSLRQVSGTTIIYAGEAEPDSPFAKLCLQLWIPPTARSFGRQEKEQQLASINELQNQLLMYRLQNYSKVKESRFDVPEFTGVSREHARMGRCLVDAPEMQSRLTAMLRPRDDAERTEAAGRLEAVVVEALVARCHQRKPSVHVAEVAAFANAILSRNGELFKLSDKQVGGKMKGLGFRTERLDSGGRGIYLLNGQCARIHELGRAFGVPTLREGLPGCPHCQKT